MCQNEKKFEIRNVSLFLHVISIKSKNYRDILFAPPLPPQRQCCYHDTKPQRWLKTFTQHCQWGEGGNSKKRSNYMSVDVSK